MKRAKLCTCLLVATTFAACSTVPSDTSFTSGDERSFVVLAVQGIGGRNVGFELQKVDRSTSKFSPDYVLIGLDPLVGDELGNANTVNTSARFAGKAVMPGEYAVVSRIEHGVGVSFTCYSQGAPLYRLEAGKVQIIQIQKMNETQQTKSAELLVEAESVLKAYPRIVAPLSVQQPLGLLKFEVAEHTSFQRRCKPTGPFSLAR